MSRVRSKNSRPELYVRRLVHGLGCRYRLHLKSLAGCPDLVLVRRKKLIFVHGCFWHRHGCSAATLPKSNCSYWQLKQTRNAERDKQNIRTLRGEGWKVLIIWECEIRNAERLQRRVRRFLFDK